MAAPIDYADWATSSVLDPVTGVPNKDMPNPTQIASGYLYLQKPVYNEFNWWQNNVGEWVRHFQDEALQGAYVFNGQKSFMNGRVGIGTNAPQQLLHIVNLTDDSARIRLQNTEGRFDILADENELRFFNTSELLVASFLNDRTAVFEKTVEAKEGLIGPVGIDNPSATQALDIIGGYILGGTNRTDTTVKDFTLACAHYTNAASQFTGMSLSAGATENYCYIGGGVVADNAATEILFYTAPNTTTPIGGIAASINGDGVFAVKTNLLYVDAPNNFVGILNADPKYELDIIGELLLGGTSRAVTSNKTFRVATAHYVNSDPPMAMLYGLSQAGVNTLSIGGGSAVVSAITDLDIYSAVTSSVPTGTLRTSMDKFGDWTFEETVRVKKGMQIDYRTAVPAETIIAAQDKTIEIGGWNMASTVSVTIAHGLTAPVYPAALEVLTVQALMRNDAASAYHQAVYDPGTAHDFKIDSIDNVNVVLSRKTGGLYDNVNYDQTSFSRGTITIKYKK